MFCNKLSPFHFTELAEKSFKKTVRIRKNKNGSVLRVVVKL